MAQNTRIYARYDLPSFTFNNTFCCFENIDGRKYVPVCNGEQSCLFAELALASLTAFWHGPNCLVANTDG